MRVTEFHETYKDAIRETEIDTEFVRVYEWRWLVVKKNKLE